MRNTLGLPLVSPAIAAILIVVILLTHGIGDHPLNELEIGGTAAALGLISFGILGLISVWVEGAELKPGRVPPHLTDPLTWSIAVIVPVLIAGGAFALARATYRDPHFDPTSADTPHVTSPGVDTYGDPGSGIEPGDFLQVDGFGRDGLVAALRRAKSIAGADALDTTEREEALARIDRLRERLVGAHQRDGPPGG